ncbi:MULTISPECIES: RNA polymerase sigma factor [Rossellomorea]|uniref:RNA polymerase sigma factor n=1 Tax=Rossellomorea TaxID=2837508 RepID=UPI001CCE06E2|nr:MULTISPECIES: RNA polymerase sigma factor [Rossellomorea]MCA0149499.1 RNA polymerase sigma factor [Rossellomorea vietnamensis]MCC5800883.1 RNA polymerase sigma factor [Rossellomorea vietnamensis]WGG46698.1 RNA polymerase sigma factor [Rossellomorea sp. DA94]
MIFDELEQTVNKLYRYCLKLSGSPWQAEDLVQETLLKIYRLKKFDPGREFTFSFLYQVAKNLFIDEKRKKKEFPSTHEDIRKVSDPTEFDALIEILLAALPLQQAMLLTLKDVFNYKTKEIAAMLRVGDESIKTALHRSRKKLNDAPEDLPVPEFFHPQLIQGLSIAIKQSNPSRIFQYYRLLETRHYKVKRFKGGAVFHIIDPDGNILEVASTLTTTSSTL